MRDKVIALSAVAVAGVAVAVGLAIGALGGAFDDGGERVAPPALRSDSLSSAPSASGTSIVIVPPSPTWQIAEPTTPRPTTTTAPSSTTSSESESTTRRPRSSRTTTEEPTSTEDADESDENSPGR